MKAEIFDKTLELSQAGILKIRKKIGAKIALANVNLFDNFICL